MFALRYWGAAGEVVRLPGITNTMLTKSLRELEEAGLVSRHNYGTVPPKVVVSVAIRGNHTRGVGRRCH